MKRGVVVQRVLAGIGVAALLVEAPLVLSSGLVMPVWALVLLIAFWVAAMVLAIVWFTRRPYLVLLLPVIMAAVWWVMLTIGERLLGWQA